MARTASPSYYRWLALGLVLGLCAVGVLAWMGIPGLGLLGLQSSITALSLAVGVVSVVLLFFLLRVGDILSVERSIHELLQSERERVARQRTTVYEFTPVVAARPPPPPPAPLPVSIPIPAPALAPVPPLQRPQRRRLTADEERHHVLELEGIGPTFASRLNSIGIISVQQLAAADPDQVARSIDVMPDLVREWQAMADLVRVKGVGAQSAELLVRAGVRSVDELADCEPEDLSRRCRAVESTRKVRLQGLQLTPAIAGRWIRAARRGDIAARASGKRGRVGRRTAQGRPAQGKPAQAAGRARLVKKDQLVR